MASILWTCRDGGDDLPPLHGIADELRDVAPGTELVPRYGILADAQGWARLDALSPVRV